VRCWFLAGINGGELVRWREGNCGDSYKPTILQSAEKGAGVRRELWQHLQNYGESATSQYHTTGRTPGTDTIAGSGATAATRRPRLAAPTISSHCLGHTSPGRAATIIAVAASRCSHKASATTATTPNITTTPTVRRGRRLPCRRCRGAPSRRPKAGPNF
jgi:hypothetical protein